MVVLDLRREVRGAPGHVVVVFFTEWQEGAEVHEVCEAAVLVQVVDEGEFGARVAHGREVFDEGYLHAGSGEEHPRVPGKVWLSFEEQDFLGHILEVVAFTEGNCNGERGRAKADADKIVGFRVVARGRVPILRK